MVQSWNIQVSIGENVYFDLDLFQAIHYFSIVRLTIVHLAG